MHIAQSIQKSTISIYWHWTYGHQNQNYNTIYKCTKQQQKRNYLDVNLTNHVQDLYGENYKTVKSKN